MIIRVFRATIREGRTADFKRMVEEQSIPWMEQADGMLGCFPGEPLPGSPREFVMVSLWRDVDALREFAGSSWDTPVVTPDEAPLVEKMSAHHYTRFSEAQMPGMPGDEA